MYIDNDTEQRSSAGGWFLDSRLNIFRRLWLSVSTSIVVNIGTQKPRWPFLREWMSAIHRVFIRCPPGIQIENSLGSILYGDRIPIDDCQRFHYSLCKRVLVDLGSVTAIITRATITTRFTIRNNARRL